MVKVEKDMKQYVNDLMNKYVGFFDVYREDKIGETPLAFKAIYKRRDEKYFISKTIKVYGVETQQCVFVAEKQEPVTKQFFNQFEKDVRANITKYVSHHSEHMSTVFLGVIVTDQPVSSELIKEVSKYRKIQFIKFGLHGWAEIYFAIVDVKGEQVYFHRKGKTFVEPFEKNFEIKGEEH